MDPKNGRGRPRQGRPRISAQQADLDPFTAAAADVQRPCRDNFAAGPRNDDGNHYVARNATPSKGRFAILHHYGDGDYEHSR